MIATSSRARHRSGLTLIEMLVVVALTVLMMTIIAQIFTATTGSIQIARAYQELEQDLRAIEGTVKRDLAGATARMTPPLNPKDNLGYFEYGENEFADAQGEDSDDYLSFTTRYTDGNFFYGRYLPSPSGMPSGTGADTRGAQATIAPTIIASDTAEVVYFLRNGNLYRRVFLVKPSLKLYHEYAFAPNGVYQGVSAGNMPGISGVGRVGWQALNDISMRPANHIAVPAGTARQNLGLPFPGEMVFDTYVNTGSAVVKFDSEARPVANSLGDLTNRENRAFKPRFTNDYYTPVIDPMSLQVVGVMAYPDGNPDDFLGAPSANTNGNFDNQINDFTSATYPNLLVNSGRTPSVYGVLVNEAIGVAGNVPYNTYTFPIDGTAATGYDTLAFPYIYPNAYSRTATYKVPLASNIEPQGAIHGISLEPPLRQFDTTYSAPQNYFLPYWNHNPLDAEDNLLTPSDPQQPPTIPNRNNQYQFYQTWWGFPTWREQLSPFWVDPLKRLDSRLQVTLPGQNGLPYLLSRGVQAYGLSWSNTQNYPGQNFGWLPEMVSPTRTRDQFFSETTSPQSGSNSFFYDNMSTFWGTTWEDDLIATNVRSFDVKVFDNSPEIQSYVDLGYFATTTGGASIAPSGSAPFAPSQTTTFSNWLLGFGHEGRMPPLTSDYRTDAQYPFIPGMGPRFVGDDSPGVVRLRRVWDTWSTDYSATEAKTLDPLTAPPFQPAPRPSYPAPYPAPLRGIQVQIRMTDPREERVRTITIHQDFTSKL